ncbi:MAG: hypothetical protein FWH21_04025, partial [Kiritimatiellaeota bacterium]|nr:hypothetical protein [Kiritimatiellota bacterium]
MEKDVAGVGGGLAEDGVATAGLILKGDVEAPDLARVEPVVGQTLEPPFDVVDVVDVVVEVVVAAAYGEGALPSGAFEVGYLVLQGG